MAGGIWTLITYRAFRLRDKARADLEDIQLRLKREPIVQVIMEDPRLVKLHSGGGFVAYIDVSMKNLGNGDVNLRVEKPPLRLARVKLLDDNALQQERVWETDVFSTIPELPRLRKDKLRPGLEERFSFAVAIDEPGIYLATFHVTVPMEHRDLKFEREPWWGTSRFFNVSTSR